MKENDNARSGLHAADRTTRDGFATSETARRIAADDVAELDRQIAEYKIRCDRGEHVSGADARWLLNEVIYQRDHSASVSAQPPAEQEGLRLPVVEGNIMVQSIEGFIHECLVQLARLQAHPFPDKDSMRIIAQAVRCAREYQTLRELSRLRAGAAPPPAEKENRK